LFKAHFRNPAKYFNVEHNHVLTVLLSSYLLPYVTLHTYTFHRSKIVLRQLNVKLVKNIHMMTHTGFIRGHINKCKNIK
jgi:hypothetical protein